MFNALKYSEELERAGFSRLQAEASVRILIEVMNNNFATKADLKELEYKLIIKLGTMITLAVGVTATLVKLLQT
jgi:hypothetical protein